MKIVFFGTPDYVLPVLETLHKAFKSAAGESPIAAVVTQPPKPTGRKEILTYSAVDAWAYSKKIPIFFKPEDIVEKKVKADLGILASYGAIIPKSAIDYLKFGILNIHPSLLPQWRGASPVQAAIVAGERQTGVTIIKLDEKLDHGPIVTQFKEEIFPQDTTVTLRERLFARSADVLTALIPAYIVGKINLREQKHENATFTTLLKKDHGFIRPSYLHTAIKGKSSKGKWNIEFIKNYTLNPSPYTLDCFIRAMQPWPQAWTLLRLSSSGQAKRLKILKAHLEKLLPNVYCLVPDVVQLEAKNPVSWREFRQAYNAQF